MPTILIVVDDLGFQRLLGISLQKYKDDFKVILANNSVEAIKIFEQQDIALLVMDLQMPRNECRVLLEYVGKQRPDKPCVFMTAPSTAAIEADRAVIGSRILKKPFTIDKFVDVVRQALEPAKLGGALRGISVANFLQMIALERKTCLMEVTSPSGSTGVLYLESGELWDAVYCDLDGESAALELIAMDDARISFGQLPEKAITRRIHKTVMAVIMEALQRKDEVYAQRKDEAYDHTWQQLA